MDESRNHYVYKARCVLPGDLQEENIDFNPEDLFAPVASNETIRLVIELTEYKELEVEGCAVDTAYLFGDLDITIRMRQLTNYSMIVSKPGCDVLFIKYLYGAR